MRGRQRASLELVGGVRLFFVYRGSQRANWSGAQVKKPIECSAPDYIEYLMEWVETQLDDEAVRRFATRPGSGPGTGGGRQGSVCVGWRSHEKHQSQRESGGALSGLVLGLGFRVQGFRV